MSAPIWLAAMVAGTVTVLGAGRRPEPDPAPPAPHVVQEVPWLTPEAAGEVIGPHGNLGPLFAGVILGGTPPLPELRARIDAFARTNHVAIDLDIVNDEVAAIRFEVKYSGCCGYEAADTFATRIRRPTRGGGCSSRPEEWINEWAAIVEDGVRMRASVRVNRVVVHWERVATFPELLERVEGMLGSSDAAFRQSVNETRPARLYRLEVPYPVHDDYLHDNLSIDVGSDGRRITEVAFSISDPHFRAGYVRDVLRARRGTQRVRARYEGDDVTTTVTLRLR